MRTRPTFVAGMFVGALGAAFGLTLLPSLVAGEAGNVRLLVGCDEGTRPRVIEALRGLPVKVLDLGTMESVSTEIRSPARVALLDSFAAWTHVNAALDTVREGAPEGARIELAGFAAGSTGITIELYVSEQRFMDMVHDHLVAHLGAVAMLQRGPVAVHEPGLFAGRLKFRGFELPISAFEASPMGSTSLPTEAISVALEKSQARLYKTGQDRQVEGWPDVVTRLFVVMQVVRPSEVGTLLTALASVPGLRVTELDWHVPTSGSAPRRLQFVLAGRIAE